MLNRAAAQAGQLAGVRTGTDITGFGLLGHGSEMAGGMRSAECGVRIWASEVPTLPGVWEYIAAGYLARGSTSNPEHFAAGVRFADSVTDAQRTLLWEAETSGGLLLAVPQENAEMQPVPSDHKSAGRLAKWWQGSVVSKLCNCEG